ncbi:hypothetical protein TcasGA2_TC031199 [Tribolium castaneum]|uniref:Uncharacterized protein n=1 Tax=Tribolium castaneum TaxID=7070 RepID=A0A139WE86_TRICA|nr:hypothetical protein TcasGA2_TC031199 [Tribolium castaneum]
MGTGQFLWHRPWTADADCKRHPTEPIYFSRGCLHLRNAEVTTLYLRNSYGFLGWGSGI